MAARQGHNSQAASGVYQGMMAATLPRYPALPPRYPVAPAAQRYPPARPHKERSPAMQASEAPSYAQLLLRPEWKACRERILARDGRRCCHCGASRPLQVHHRQYHYGSATGQMLWPWQYPDHLLITLCTHCHPHGHRQHQVPVYPK